MNRTYSIDYFKFFAILAIVIIHSEPFCDYSFTNNLFGNKLFFFIDTLTRWAVPFFFITSGYLLNINVNKKGLSYIKKYLIRIYGLFIEWTIIYIIIYLILTAITCYFTGNSFKEKFIEIFKPALNIRNLVYYTMSSGFTIIFHFWFLIALFWSAAILAVFIKIKKIKILLFISLIFHLFGLFGQSLRFIIDVPFSTNDAIFIGLFYVTLGYYIKDLDIKTFKRSDFILLLILFIVINFLERGILVYYFNAPWGDYHLSTIPLVIVLFIYCITKPEIGKNSKLSIYGSNSLGIYVLHISVISVYSIIINKIGYFDTLLNHLFIVPVVFITSYSIYKIYEYFKTKIKAAFANLLRL